MYEAGQEKQYEHKNKRKAGEEVAESSVEQNEHEGKQESHSYEQERQINKDCGKQGEEDQGTGEVGLEVPRLSLTRQEQQTENLDQDDYGLYELAEHGKIGVFLRRH